VGHKEAAIMNMDDSQKVFPEDQHNQVLVSNVSPPGWKNPEPSGRYNLVVIGAGTAGLVTAAEAAAVQYDRKNGVTVNDHLQTSNPRIYAAGDICLQYKFTHTADATARIVIQNALFMGRKKLSGLTIPWVTYTDPEVAHVGMYERDARERGIEVDTFVRPLSEVDRAVLDGEDEGFVTRCSRFRVSKHLIRSFLTFALRRPYPFALRYRRANWTSDDLICRRLGSCFDTSARTVGRRHKMLKYFCSGA